MSKLRATHKCILCIKVKAPVIGHQWEDCLTCEESSFQLLAFTKSFASLVSHVAVNAEGHAVKKPLLAG